MGTTVKATINGQARELQPGTTLLALLESVQAPASGIAVAKNDRVVRRGEFLTERVEDGDRIEIIKAVAGG